METCYRHPDRETRVSCSNCGRPICPDCMTSTPVGMRCPECARQRTKVVNPTGSPGRGDALATYAIIGLCVAAFLAEVFTGADLMGGNAGDSIVIDFGLFAFGGVGFGVAEGEVYRVLTAGFLHSGIIHLGLNMFALYILGRLLEPAIGTRRFVGIYLVSVLAGSCGALILSPDQLTVGASGGIFGLMAAAFLIARNRGLDELASQIGLFVVLNLVFTFSVPNISIGGHLGGLVGGGVAALLVNHFHGKVNREATVLESAGLVALCVIAVVGSVLAAEAAAPDFGLG